jgi:hypothetical protein
LSFLLLSNGFLFLSSFVFPLLFDIVLFMFLWLMWFHLYPTPTCLELKGLVVVVVVENTDTMLGLQMELSEFTHCYPSHGPYKMIFFLLKNDAQKSHY